MLHMILVIPDKYKGSMTAMEASVAIAEGLVAGGCREEIMLCPLADGGEGMPEELEGRPVVSTSLFVGKANAELSAKKAMFRSSAPLGRWLLENYGPGTRGGAATDYVWLAVGGTLTVDGGAGALQALGLRFRDNYGNLFTKDVTPAMLPFLSPLHEDDFDGIDMNYWRGKVHVLSDVRATLTGPGLSALDFTLQKGVDAKYLPFLRSGYANLQRVLGREGRTAVDGAGGGIGYAFASVIGSPWSMGADVMLQSRRIDWDGVTLVISGEGCIDSQTAGGKVVDAVRREAMKRGLAFVAVGGYVEPQLRGDCVLSTIADAADYDPSLATVRLRDTVARYFRAK